MLPNMNNSGSNNFALSLYSQPQNNSVSNTQTNTSRKILTISKSNNGQNLNVNNSFSKINVGNNFNIFGSSGESVNKTNQTISKYLNLPVYQSNDIMNSDENMETSPVFGQLNSGFNFQNAASSNSNFGNTNINKNEMQFQSFQNISTQNKPFPNVLPFLNTTSSNFSAITTPPNAASFNLGVMNKTANFTESSFTTYLNHPFQNNLITSPSSPISLGVVPTNSFPSINTSSMQSAFPTAETKTLSESSSVNTTTNNCSFPTFAPPMINVTTAVPIVTASDASNLSSMTFNTVTSNNLSSFSSTAPSSNVSSELLSSSTPIIKPSSINIGESTFVSKGANTISNADVLSTSINESSGSKISMIQSRPIDSSTTSNKGLGGTLDASKESSSMQDRGNSKVRESELPVQLKETVGNLENFISSQKERHKDIVNLSNVNDLITDIGREYETLNQTFYCFSNDLLKMQSQCSKMKNNVYKELSSIRSVQGALDYKDGVSFGSSDKYFVNKSQEFDGRLNLFSREVETVESSFKSPEISQISSNILVDIMKNMDDEFADVSAKVYTVHTLVKELKTEYLRKNKFMNNPFLVIEERFKDSNIPTKTLPIKTSSYIKDRFGRSPFVTSAANKCTYTTFSTTSVMSPPFESLNMNPPLRTISTTFSTFNQSSTSINFGVNNPSTSPSTVVTCSASRSLRERRKIKQEEKMTRIS